MGKIPCQYQLSTKRVISVISDTFKIRESFNFFEITDSTLNRTQKGQQCRPLQSLRVLKWF